MAGVADSCRQPHATQLASFSPGIKAEDYTHFMCDLTGGFFPPPHEKQTPTLLLNPLPFTLHLEVIKDLNCRAVVKPI